MKTILTLLIALMLVAGATAQQLPAANTKAPEVILKDTSGKEVKLSSLKGKVVLIDFWASWCGPCRRANKHLKKLYEEYKDKGLEILSISVDDSKSAWIKAINEDKSAWLQVLDEKNIANSWRIEYIPTTFLIDKTGKIVASNPKIEKLDDLIKDLLK